MPSTSTTLRTSQHSTREGRSQTRCTWQHSTREGRSPPPISSFASCSREATLATARIRPSSQQHNNPTCPLLLGTQNLRSPTRHKAWAWPKNTAISSEHLQDPAAKPCRVVGMNPMSRNPGFPTSLDRDTSQGLPAAAFGENWEGSMPARARQASRTDTLPFYWRPTSGILAPGGCPRKTVCA